MFQSDMESSVRLAACKDGQVHTDSYLIAEVTKRLIGHIETELFVGRLAAADSRQQAAVQCTKPDVKVLFSLGGFSSARISFRISHSD